MKLIIDIPKNVYEEIMTHNRELRESGKSAYYFEGLIQNGTPYNLKGDLISREDLKNDLITFFPDKCLEGITAKTLFKQILTDINNAPTVSDRYDEGYAQGYIDGSTGADWKGGAE